MNLPGPGATAAHEPEEIAGAAADRRDPGAPVAPTAPAAPAMTPAEQQALRRKLQDKFH